MTASNTSNDGSVQPSIDIFPSATIAPISPRLFSGFLEHLGRCIYGGILPATPSTFPHSSRNPCPPAEFTPTPPELLGHSDFTKYGFNFRKDVVELLRDELRVPVVRWPGGNYVSSYHWQDGIGPRDKRVRRPELAWGGEESNQFGTDEFIGWCREAKIEPYIILNMGDGTLEEALRWVEYCNGTGDTHYANLRRENTGRDEPYNVKYWGLGNEVYGPWQVGQQTAEDYTVKARQWAHALKLLDPNIKLIACGWSGSEQWDSVVLDGLIDKTDLTSLHMYTGFGERDRSDAEREYGRGVYGPEAAEFSIEVCKGLINKARLAKKVDTPYKIAFDEYGVWDESIGTPQNGLEQFYNFADALAMASWLNVFVRQADVVDIACVAQSVNVISPLIVRPTGLFRQTVYHPLHLFSKYMRDGSSVSVHVESPVFTGETLPTWIGTVKGPSKHLDVSAVLCTSGSAKSVRIAVINRSLHTAYDVPLRIAFEKVKAGADVEVHEMWHEDLKAKNGFDGEKVGVTSRSEKWEGRWRFREHSFTLLILTLD